MTYYSPKYWKEMAAIRRKHQASSERSPGPGLKRQASSSKPQAKPEPSSGSSNNL